jgi:nucleoside-diphosphate-sugar epimerase
MTKTLVVGGSGYVGRELVRQLNERHDEVYVLGRSKPSLGTSASWIEADITQAESLQTALGDHRFEIIHHVASLPGDTGDPVQMVKVNLLGLTNMLVYARDTAVRRFVLSSSISAYEWYPATPFNPPEYLPVDENHPTRPKDMYATTKRLQEMLALTFFHQYKLPVTVLRLTAVVGPHGRGGGRGWREFASMLAKRKKVQIPHFSLDEVCHYVDYRDVAQMHIVAGEHPNASGEIFNCCGPTATSGSEFAAIVTRLVPGIQVDTGFPWSMAQGQKICFDMSKAKALIGYEPRYSLEDSLLSILAWIDSGGFAGDRDENDAVFGEGVSR